MKSIVLSLAIILGISPIFSAKKIFTLEKAKQQEMIRTKVVKVTGFKGKCLTLELENYSEDSLFVLIPAGWIFDSDDSTKQNLLVVKEFVFRLAKKEKRSEAITVNCCQLHNHSPAGSKFSKGFTAKKELTELAQYLSNEEFKEQTVCSAVWAVSDNSPISQICGSGVDNDEKLRKKVAEIKKCKVPWYKVKTKLIEEANGTITKQLTNLYGEFECNITTGSEYTVKLTDKKGNEIMVLSPLRKMTEDNKNYIVDFPISQLPEKEFNITFYDKWGVIYLEKSFDLKS